MTTSTPTDLSVLPDMSGLAPLHPTLPHAVIYTQPVCPTCTRVKGRMFKTGMPMVAIDMTSQPDVVDQFASRLGVNSTPVTLIHNVFDRPVYFWSTGGGMPLDQIKLTTKSAAERLAHMEMAGAFKPDSDADSYIDELLDVAQAHSKTAPALTPEQYIEIAAKHIAPIRLQAPRIELGTQHLLSVVKDEAPPVLLD